MDPITFKETVKINWEVNTRDVSAVISMVLLSKAPGPDRLSNKLLKACNEEERLSEALLPIIQAGFKLSYFPRCFREATVVVLRKPNKTLKDQKLPGAYRPISLLSALGKIIEILIVMRLTAAIEENGILPRMQMGFRHGRSTEVAIRLVTDVVHTTWAYNAIASLLQLDLTGAFDRVDWIWLMHTFRELGYEWRLIRWLQSYFEDRTARLHFDGVTSEPYRITQGTPQGSPLSPILFIIFISTLYQRLEEIPNLITVGFADDTNLLAYARDTKTACETLERGYKVCEEWAKERGMEFNPSKSELIYFTRTRRMRTDILNILGEGNPGLVPVESARFLGVWLDRKLSFTKY